MPNTARGYPYPDPDDPPAHASDMQNLAEAVNDDVTDVEGDLASAQAQLDALEAQALVVLDAVQEDTTVSAMEFTSIDQSYDHLLLYWRGDAESGVGYVSLNARFNGDDSTDGYTSQRASFATLSSTWTEEFTSGGGPFFTVMRMGLVGNAAGSGGHIFIPFYSVPAFIKSAVGVATALRTFSGDTYPTTGQAGGRWLSATDAITSIWLSPGGGSSWDRVRAHLIGIRSGT